MTILGLSHSKKYDCEADMKSLRYGKLMLMTDQDADGSHIKGLIINFLHFFWPKLLERNDFLQVFRTPLLKVSQSLLTHSFFSFKDYLHWIDGKDASKFKIKYYKGLGTSTSKEGKEYFADLKKHRLDFIWQGEKTNDDIDLAFNKSRADDRKNWLSNFSDTEENKSTDAYNIDYSDFIHKELILFSLADNMRSIPSIVCLELFSCHKFRWTD